MDAKTLRRFFEKVKKTKSCWLWVAGKTNGGYGHFRVGSRKVLAHRVSWQIERGDIHEGMKVLHKCDVPNCVNPEHLFLGTIKDNVRDMYQKGRQNRPTGERHGSKTHPESILRGERNGRSKLTQEEANEIRRIYIKGARGEFSQRGLAEKYGVAHSQIGLIVNNKAWYSDNPRIEIEVEEIA